MFFSKEGAGESISAREDRLRRLGVEDQKAALQKQIEAIQDQAEAQFTALDSQQEEIEKAYAERMKTAALRAEAEKLLMTGNQREIVSLIGEFAPEYDALGKTLGEKLLEGFQSKVGGVVAWFQSLNDSLYQIQEQTAAEAIAAANQFQSGYQQRQQNSAAANNLPPTVVNQTVNFNEPVESAGEAASWAASLSGLTVLKNPLSGLRSKARGLTRKPFPLALAA